MTALRRPDAADRPIVAVGTSLTVRGGWLAPLSAAIGEERPATTIAAPGATSRDALRRLDEILDARPSVALIELAANDAALGRGVAFDESLRNLAAILDGIAARFPDARRIVMAMNPVRGVQRLPRLRLDRLADAHLALAAARDAETLDARPAWRALGRAALRAAIPDGLHPRESDAAAIMVPLIRAALARPSGDRR